MALAVETFRHEGPRHYGTTLFKALGHPRAAPVARALVEELRGSPVAVVDIDGGADTFDAFYGLGQCDIAGVFVQRLDRVGQTVLGRPARAISGLAGCGAAAVFVAAFDSARAEGQLRTVVPEAAFHSFDALRLDNDWLSNPRRYLDPLNFATNFAFLRDGGGHHTAVRSANYWGGYGATDAELWCCLFGEDGGVLAEWRQPLPPKDGSLEIDSREVRARFGLGDFAGSLFVHAMRIRGHNVVKYAIDTYGDDATVLSATHDANAWPADLYAGLPAPADGERVLLWVQNSHPVPVPGGAIGFNRMGSPDIAWYPEEIPAFATRAVDAGALVPTARWPDQLEVQAGRYFVRPRYEIVRGGRSRIAHVNVERTDLAPDPALPGLATELGKGFLLPLPVLPVARFRTEVLPTPMATGQQELPIAALLYDRNGNEVARHRFGRLARRHAALLEVDTMPAAAELEDGWGHVELVYDFADGGEADGWLHAIARYTGRSHGHVAETSFGTHVYNTLAVHRDEPQSYAGPPPGLSTRLFLRLGPVPLETICHLVYPASLPFRPTSDTTLQLKTADGGEIAAEHVAIPCSGSLLWSFSEVFDATARKRAGPGATVLVRDSTCRLFGFHGLVSDGEEAFSLDHMFGF